MGGQIGFSEDLEGGTAFLHCGEVSDALLMGDRESMSSTALIEALIDMDEAPWKEWRHGSPITTSGIARILKPYKVGPHRSRVGSSYRASDLQDPWSRYLNQKPDADTTRGAI